MFSMDYILTNLPMFKTQRVLDILRMFQDLLKIFFHFNIILMGIFKNPAKTLLYYTTLNMGGIYEFSDSSDSEVNSDND